ncbi:MAG TPA: class I SAM-dependent methyltransferase [Candidatus Krumholzibacteria bacterium]|nr:class I SAM-dependent methyltransferase [Candidatus Krumholzibacteria bacterium]
MPETTPGASPDPYAGLPYRRLFDWEDRLARESPFLLDVLRRSPEASLLDLGCGTGEHTIHFARAGFQVVGVDRSAAQLEQAREKAANLSVRFVQADLSNLGPALDRRFGGSICLGNTLVHVLETQDLERTCHGVHAALYAGGSWTAQILNYERILTSGVRHLPLQFRADGDGEIVFLRLLRPMANGRVQFFPTVLRLHPEAEVPVEVVNSHSTTLRAWQRHDLEPALRQAGFDRVEWYGDLRGGPYHLQTSTDLVFVATRH